MSAQTTSLYTGQCHCGGVQFTIESIIQELTTCNCSICKKKNALMLKVHENEFTLVKGENLLTRYQFHTHTAHHYFCRNCGIYPFHRKRVTPDYYGINVHCLDDFPIENFDVRETHGSEMS